MGLDERLELRQRARAATTNTFIGEKVPCRKAFHSPTVGEGRKDHLCVPERWQSGLA